MLGKCVCFLFLEMNWNINEAFKYVCLYFLVFFNFSNIYLRNKIFSLNLYITVLYSTLVSVYFKFLFAFFFSSFQLSLEFLILSS